MIKHSHLPFSTAAPCVQARLASPIHPQGTLDTLTHKSWAKSFFSTTKLQHICATNLHTSPKNFKILLFFLRISTIYQRIAFFVGFGGGIL